MASAQRSGILGQDLAASLTGHRNALVHWREARLARGDWDAIDCELARDVAAVPALEGWSGWGKHGVAAKAQTLGILHAARAAVVCEKGAPPEGCVLAELPASALTHLLGAFGLAWRPQAAAPPAPHAALRTSVAEEVVAALERLEREALASVRSAEPVAYGDDPLVACAALRSLLARLRPRLRGLVPSEGALAGREERIHILSDRNNGSAYRVILKLAPSPYPERSVISPQLLSLGATVLDRTFLQASGHALACARDLCRRRPLPPIWVRWSIQGTAKVPALEDASAGGAFALGILALLEGRRLDPHSALTAILIPPAEGAEERRWELGPVGPSLERKRNAARKARPAIRRIYSGPEGADAPED